LIGGVDDLRAEIQAIAGKLGVAASDLSRARFRAEHPEGARRVVDRCWAEAKAGAQVRPEDVPLVPPGFEIHGVSTFEGGKWVKATRVKESREQTLSRLLTELPALVPARETLVKIPREAMWSRLVSVYPMGDPHIGMLAWRKESGESWDLEIAERMNAAAITDLVQRGPRSETALLVNLGDFFHSDTPHGTTTAGTRLDVDGRWAKTLDIGMRVITHTIDRLLEHHARVIVDCQIGNHDEHSSIMLAIGLRSHYRNEPRCTVTVDPNPFHFYKFGEVLIGTTHGDACKHEALPEIMAADCGDWSATKHRHWLIGHVHHNARKDLRGCSVESFRTLATRDAWHHKSGYRAPRDMQRIVYHHAFGEVSREVCSADLILASMEP
jgi:hypothetical protein